MKLLSKAAVREKVCLSFAEIARREKKMRFPSRLRLGEHRTSRTVWLEDEIDAWIAEQVKKQRIDS